MAGYTGKFCQECDQNRFCFNGGTTVETGLKGQPVCQCSCPPETSGDRCQELLGGERNSPSTVHDECAKLDCQNGGNCVTLLQGGGGGASSDHIKVFCNCTMDYGGVQCADKIPGTRRNLIEEVLIGYSPTPHFSKKFSSWWEIFAHGVKFLY